MILLLSGGLDSIAAWRLLDLPPAVNFDLGTRPQRREQEALGWARFHFRQTYLVRRMPMGEHEAANGYLPFRNPLMILAAAQIDPTVYIGQIAEWAPDKNARFYRRLERTVNVEGQLADFSGQLRIVAPFSHLAKGELIALYCQRFGKAETDALLDHTWSCYANGARHCGRCGGCVQRWNAEAHYAKLTGQPLKSATSTYDRKPPLMLTPNADQLRWIRDNGWRGVQQIRARRRQNNSAKEQHAALVPDLPTVVPLRTGG